MGKELFLLGLKITEALLKSREFLFRSRVSDSCFIRRRKMGFEDLIRFMLGIVKKTLSLELFRFHETIEAEGFSMTKQAFSKARQKIKPEALKELYQKATVEPYMRSTDIKRYKGYRIFAIDGTELELPPTKQNIEHYGTRGNSEKACRARASYMYDVLGEVLVDASIESSSVAERLLAMQHLEHFSSYANEYDIVIFDRGYPSRAMLAKCSEMGIKFLMRLQKSFSQAIDADHRSDFYHEVEYEGKTYKLRVLKFELDSGETEILITNLGRTKFRMKDFKRLYFMRWPIETKYNYLKNCLLLEHFTGKTRVAIEQDFYATAYMSNMAAFAQMQADETIKEEDSKKELKYERKANRQMMVGLLKDKFILMLLCNDEVKQAAILDSILREAVRYKTLIRPGRQFDRGTDSHYRRRLRRNGAL